MIISITLTGLLYALPNLYGEDLGIQITGIHGMAVNKKMLFFVQNYLKEQNITAKSVTLERDSILIRFYSINNQLLARDLLIKKLGDNFIIAFNLTPATPHWLNTINAEPIKLGLDLRGGIHFLMEVDVDNVLDKLQEKNINNLREDLRNNKIPYLAIRKEANYRANILLPNIIACNHAIDYIKNHYHDLIIYTKNNNHLCTIITNTRIQKTREYVVQQNINILRNRINQLGISEPLVQQQGTHYIAIELPGIQDTARAKEILSTTATLEFRLVNTNFDKNTNINYALRDSEVKHTKEGHPILLYKRVILTGDHIINSTSNQDEYNHPQVNISLDILGGNIMSNFTKENIGKTMAILLVEYKDSGKKDTNGHTIFIKEEKIINIANIQSRLGHSFRITGIDNRNEARQLSLLLRAGALIAPIRIIEERVVGPTLGIENIKQGLKACMASLISSILFMIFFYKIFGLIASAALITNLILLIGAMSLLPEVRLTMPGIAGIVLTITIAVDANVLINERIKEELKNGCTVQQAIHEGYRGAFNSIFDANMTTMIKIFILYVVSSGTIKGFAITTGIGLATSMFTTIIGTRSIVNLMYGCKRIRKLSI